MQYLDAAADRRHLSHQLFLQPGLLFERRRGDDAVRFQLDVDRKIIDGVGDWRWRSDFRGNPYTMSAAALPGGLATLAGLVREYMEHIPAAGKRVSYDARPNIARHDQFHFAVSHAIAVRPSVLIDFFDYDGRARIHLQNLMYNRFDHGHFRFPGKRFHQLSFPIVEKQGRHIADPFRIVSG